MEACIKRFTETTKWDDPWFWTLSPTAKLLWQYLLDHCDNAGVVEFNTRLASFKIGDTVEEKHLTELGDRVQLMSAGKYRIPKFVRFQFGELTDRSLIHRSVLKLLAKHGIGYPMPIPCQSLPDAICMPQEKVQVQEKEERKEKVQSAIPCPSHAHPIASGVEPDLRKRIEAINLWFSEQMGHDAHMDSGIEMLWARWFASGFEEDDFKKVFKMKWKFVEERGDHPGSLRISNLLMPDAFRENLALAKQNFVLKRNGAQETPLWKKAELLRQQIDTHAANKSFRGYDARAVTPEMSADLKSLRQKLSEAQAAEAAR